MRFLQKQSNYFSNDPRINVKINANIVIRRITIQKIHDTDKYRINNDILYL